MLDLETLKSRLKALFEGTAIGGFPTDDAATGQQWAAAYRAFVKEAQPNGLPNLFPVSAVLDVAVARLAAGLAIAFEKGRAAGPAGIGVVTPLFEAAFASFWQGDPKTPTWITFAAPPPPATVGVVTALPTTTPGLAQVMAGVFLAGVPATGPAPSAQSQAHAVAVALDAWTRGVTASYTIPPNAPVTGVTLL